jgi:uncharacterized tellurite resistance protein B-like protein
MRGLVQIIFGLILGVIGAVWVGPARNMLADETAKLTATLLGEYAQQPIPVALLLAAGLYVVTGLITMVLSGFGHLFKADVEGRQAAKRLDLFHELLTGATVRMVGADGKIEPAELSMVSGLLEKFGQTPVAEKTIRSIAASFNKDPERYLKMMTDKAGNITDEQKASILRACLLVSMADVTVDVAEVEYLKRVAQALKVAPERLAKIREELTSVTQKLMGAAAFAA